MEKEVFCPICGSSLGVQPDSAVEAKCKVCGANVYLAVKNPVQVSGAESKKNKKGTLPFKFPANSGFGKFLFWFVFVLTLLSTAASVILFIPSLTKKINVTFGKFVWVVVLALVLLSVTAVWIIYYLMRKTRKYDQSKPLFIKILQWFLLIAFLISLCAFITLEGCIVISNKLPELIAEGSLASTICEFETYMNIVLYALGISFGALILICIINGARYKAHVKENGSRFAEFFSRFFVKLAILAVAVLVIAIALTIVDKYTDIVTSVLNESAEYVMFIVSEVLLYSAVASAGTLLLAGSFATFRN